MAKKSFETLTKIYEQNYYDVILDSFANGHKSQAIEQFKEMKSEDRKGFWDYCNSVCSQGESKEILGIIFRELC